MPVLIKPFLGQAGVREGGQRVNDQLFGRRVQFIHGNPTHGRHSIESGGSEQHDNEKFTLNHASILPHKPNYAKKFRRQKKPKNRRFVGLEYWILNFFLDFGV
jgi:hypothetical protein